MPLSLQAKFLRAIQENEIRRVGSVETITINCRFVAATKYDLEQRVALNLFREDLYARLFTYPLHVTGLKDRPDDIPLIGKSMVAIPETFWKEPSHEEPDNMPPFPATIMNQIYKYNVRAIEAALARWRAYGSYE
jgi:transcriptional regulator with GAF, ATPase, and Fis domain